MAIRYHTKLVNVYGGIAHFSDAKHMLTLQTKTWDRQRIGYHWFESDYLRSGK